MKPIVQFLRTTAAVAASVLECSALLGIVILLAGCQNGATQLMPTPNLYAWETLDPFADVPKEYQNNYADVLYFTDRAPEPSTKADSVYGYKRSRSLAFGVSRVQFGKDVSWQQLVKASRSTTRLINLELSVQKTTELGRFPPTPRALVAMPAELAATRPAGEMLGDVPDAEQLAAEALFRREMSARLATSPVKDVYVFVHGYSNKFYDSVVTIAQLWHFFGRQGVPVAYSWPAGSGGLLRGYEYDSASSEFTVLHLKQTLRLIASCPDVRKVHIICHSRGTDTTLNALRELHMEINASGRNTRQVLKLGTLILAAPDIDLDVVIQKVVPVRLGAVPERFAMYICAKDKALGLSSWLFGGLQRLGEIKAEMFKPAELEVLRNSETVQIIDARVTNLGDFAHNYFYANPAVSSDLVLLMRYQLSPGAHNGRPLRTTAHGFWAIDDSYPGSARDIPVEKNGK